MTNPDVHDLIRRGAEIRLKEIAEIRTALEREHAKLLALVKPKKRRRTGWTAAARKAQAKRMKQRWKTQRPMLERAIAAARKNGGAKP